MYKQLNRRSNIKNDKIVTQQSDEAKLANKTAVRRKDLSTRERVNFVLSSEIVEELRTKSAAEKIPMSRIIDIALSNYLNNPSHTISSLNQGIILYHTLDLLLSVTFDSPIAKEIMKYTEIYFDDFTFSSCLFKKATDECAIIGTKIISFISDAKSDSLSKFIDVISKSNNTKYIEMFIDGQQIQI